MAKNHPMNVYMFCGVEGLWIIKVSTRYGCVIKFILWKFNTRAMC